MNDVLDLNCCSLTHDRCAVTYLLMAILAASTFSSPVTQRKKKMCGKDLPKSIAEVCEIYEDFFSPTEPREGTFQLRKIEYVSLI